MFGRGDDQASLACPQARGHVRGERVDQVIVGLIELDKVLALANRIPGKLRSAVVLGQGWEIGGEEQRLQIAVQVDAVAVFGVTAGLELATAVPVSERGSRNSQEFGR